MSETKTRNFMFYSVHRLGSWDGLINQTKSMTFMAFIAFMAAAGAAACLAAFIAFIAFMTFMAMTRK